MTVTLRSPHTGNGNHCVAMGRSCLIEEDHVASYVKGLIQARVATEVCSRRYARVCMLRRGNLVPVDERP